MFRAVAVLFLLLAVQLHAKNLSDTVLIDHSIDRLNPIPQTFFTIDTDNSLGFENLQAIREADWQHIPKEKPSFGFSPHSHWFTFTIENTSSNDLSLFLELSYALLDQVTIKTYEPGGTTVLDHVELGDTKPFSERPLDHHNFVMPISLAPHSSKEFLMKVNSLGPIQVPLQIWQQDYFQTKASHESFLYGAFLSALLIMSAYYFFLFVIVKDKSYLLYVAYIVSMAGVHSSLDGYSYQWFWPDSPNWNQIAAVTFISIGLLTTVLFTRSLLPIPVNSWMERYTRYLSYVAFASVLFTQVLPYQYAAMLNGSMTVIVMSSVAITCIAMLSHSPRIAKFFCFAWGAYFIGILLKSAAKLGYLPSNYFTEYAGNLGAVIGVIVIALALADRINTEKRAKEKAKNQSIRNLQRFETLYQNAREGIFTLNSEGGLLSANPAFLKVVGLTRVEDFNGSWCQSSGYHLSQSDFEHFLSTILEHGSVVDYEAKMSQADGSYIWVSISARAAYEEAASSSSNSSVTTPSIEGTLINISERKAFEEQLKHLAEHDSLTGFFNRRAFEAATKTGLERVRNQEDNACLLYIDLDQFKIVNDLCGHTAGDQLLKKLSQTLMEVVESFGKDQLIARLGGDEFGVLLRHTGIMQAREAAEAIRATVESFLFVWEGKRYTVGASIGLVEMLPFHTSVEQLLVMADTACYMAKDQGRNRVHIFVESDRDLQFRQLEMQWVNTIKEALDNDHFFLVFQHITPTSGPVTSYHYEILIRLMSPNGHLCAPNQFLPAAERYNLMPNIDRWVITHFFKWLSNHPEHLRDLSCASINLSTQSLGDEDFSKYLVSVFTEYDIPGHKICFEITEGMAITHLKNTHAFIQRFRSLGCRFALDDFGTGFSSYAYLKQLDIDYLKIDGVFIKNLCDDDVNIAMVKSINDVAKAIGIETVAEFVENPAIQDKLKEIGITYSQGYHIHKPVKLLPEAFEPITRIS